MNIDIICPLYNAENEIENLHKMLLKQKMVEINEIRYILTESQDKTENILKELKIKYKKIKKEEFSHSLTREKEAFESTADIIVFITQDIVIKREDWLYYLTKDIAEGTVQATYSRQICENNSIEKYTRQYNYPNISRIVSKKDIDKLGLNTFFFSDASSALKRDVFLELNGYDQKELPTNEDMYFAYKLIKNGYKIKYCADSEVIHSHKFTLRQYYNRYRDTGKFFRQNEYLDKFGTNKAGGGMAKYILKSAMHDQNWKVILQFFPNVLVRYLGMQIGKKTNK